jgi:RNA polymerase sigma-70 factor (ECF subfamily)
MIESTTKILIQPDEEKVLLNRALSDPNAFGRLYQVYVKPIYRYVYYRVGNKMDAEDLTAQVFIQAFEGINRYRHDGHFLAWLTCIARRRVADYFRQNKPLENLEKHEALLLENALSQVESEQADRLNHLAICIGRMDKEEKELLRLRYATGLTFQEMASVTGDNLAAIKKRFYRLLDRIKLTVEGGANESR